MQEPVYAPGSAEHLLRATVHAVTNRMAVTGGLYTSAMLRDVYESLGCPYKSSTKTLVTPPDRGYDPYVLSVCYREILAAILPSPYRCGEDVKMLLAGILRYGLWDDFLDHEDSARDLAVAVILYSETYSDNNAIDVAILGELCMALNQWLKPSTPCMGVLGVLPVARHMFGAVWWPLMELTTNVHERLVGDIVLRERPPFLPGLCRAQDAIRSATLPDNLGPSI
jgi:hypothetical protein